MDQAFSRPPVTPEAWVQSQASPDGICGGEVALGQCFLRAVSF